MVDLKLLEQKRTSAVVCSEIKPRVRKDQKKKKKSHKFKRRHNSKEVYLDTRTQQGEGNIQMQMACSSSGRSCK